MGGNHDLNCQFYSRCSRIIRRFPTTATGPTSVGHESLFLRHESFEWKISTCDLEKVHATIFRTMFPLMNGVKLVFWLKYPKNKKPKAIVIASIANCRKMKKLKTKMNTLAYFWTFPFILILHVFVFPIISSNIS